MYNLITRSTAVTHHQNFCVFNNWKNTAEWRHLPPIINYQQWHSQSKKPVSLSCTVT